MININLQLLFFSKVINSGQTMNLGLTQLMMGFLLSAHPQFLIRRWIKALVSVEEDLSRGGMADNGGKRWVSRPSPHLEIC